MPEIGKISPEIFTEGIFPRLGAKSKDIIAEPQHGVDVGIVRIGDKAVLLPVTPVFIARSTAGSERPGCDSYHHFRLRDQRIETKILSASI